MPSARCIFVFAFALSVMVASPAQSYPTAVSPRSRSAEPNTLLGRQYQLTKRDPLILLDPALDQGLDTSQLESDSTETPKRPEPEPRRPYKQEEPMEKSKTTESNSTNSTASYNSQVAARRLMPYREQRAKRASIQRLEPRNSREISHVARSKKPPSRFSFDSNESIPETPSAPPVENSFGRTATVDAAFSQPTLHRTTHQTSHASGEKLVAGLLSGLTSPVK